MVRLLWLVAFMAAGATATLRPMPDKLEPWTTQLRDRQPEDAFAAVYRVGKRRLVFVAAKHENRNESPTFRLIRDAYARFQFNTVIAEGFPTSRGANPPSIRRYVLENGVREGGFVEGGETVPTVLGAERERAMLWGGEADDLDVKAKVLASGVSAQDILGFYALRNIPQWVGERRIENAGDPRLRSLVVEALARDRQTLGLPSNILPGFAEWAAWYKALNGKSIGSGFLTEEVGPLSDGTFRTNRIAYALSRVRDAYLHELIIKHLNARESVLVVFGGSHLIIHRPALDAALGRPCYVGADLRAAASSCR
jgi:hypothetical protein